MFRNYFRIDLSEVQEPYREELLLQVLPSSPLSLRKEVERIAHYFKRELQFAFVQFAANDKAPYTAYLFRSGDNVCPYVWVGACCLRIRNGSRPGVMYEALQWIWIHPYFRNQGILAEFWPILRRDHGEFILEKPLSSAMEGFLLKKEKETQKLAALEKASPLQSN